MHIVTLSFSCGVQDSMFHLHVSTQVALQIELAGAVRTLEGFATGMKVHVTQQVVHSVEGLPAHLQKPIQELLEVYDAQLYQAEKYRLSGGLQ